MLSAFDYFTLICPILFLQGFLESFENGQHFFLILRGIFKGGYHNICKKLKGILVKGCFLTWNILL